MKRGTVAHAAVVGAFVLVSFGCKSNSISQNNGGTATIGSGGGIVDGPDGAELRIPAGALTKDTAFTISLAQAGSYPAPPVTVDVGGNHV